MVASTVFWGLVGYRLLCFNPLHCGAVVASYLVAFSVFFISLFQSPSLRGSGRFGSPKSLTSPDAPCFNPLHCGAVVASEKVLVRRPLLLQVSIPFIAGQWSLLQWPLSEGVTIILFQSPSLRGSGRFRADMEGCGLIVTVFQSPSLRGSGRFEAVGLDISFFESCFNPLHCGAVVASSARARRRKARREVSIPFIAGQWSLLHSSYAHYRLFTRFQSPSLRGSGRFRLRPAPPSPPSPRFNPLHCGAVVASRS